MKDLSIFSNLDFLEREAIGRLAVKRVYHKNEFIFREGETADTIYMVKSGRVRLFKVSTSGKDITLGILKNDDLFGENTMFEEAFHSMSAQALENTFVCSCSKKHVPLLLKNPYISMKIIQYLGEKIQNYTEQVANIAFRNVKGRVSSTLLRLARDYGYQSDQGTIIDIELTHQDLASLVNASRVMVSYVLRDLRDEGAISIKDHRITLLNREKLAQTMDVC
ncbi:MAG: Crp/Fnr family transcriptional regulator [Bacillota bacterium]